MKLKESPTVSLAEKGDIDALERQYLMAPAISAFENSITATATTNKRNTKAEAAIARTVIIGSAAGATLLYSEAVFSAPDPNVQAVVTTVTDTVPLLTTITTIVFSAGLGPWAARTCLAWLGSIVRGSV